MLNQYNASQQMRPESERNLSDWERSALDQRRNDEMTNINSNPAIWSKLREIEAKLDKVLDLLHHHAKSDEQKTNHHNQEPELVADIHKGNPNR